MALDLVHFYNNHIFFIIRAFIGSVQRALTFCHVALVLMTICGRLGLELLKPLNIPLTFPGTKHFQTLI